MQHEYTPTIEEVLATLRSNYQVVMSEWQEDDTDRLVEYGAHFDSVIAEIEAAAEQRGAERGWDEGQKSGLRYAERALAAQKIGRPDLPGPPTTNPYRAAQMEGDDV